MNAKERYLYLGVIVLLAAGCLYLAIRPQGAGEKEALARAAQTEKRLQAELDKALVEIGGLEAALVEERRKAAELARPKERDSSQPVVLMDDVDMRALQRAGLSQPATQVVADLVARRELLPMQGVLGGTMAFRPSDRWVVARSWVLAEFDDGHIMGRGIFKYTVKDGKITWTRLDWYSL